MLGLGATEENSETLQAELLMNWDCGYLLWYSWNKALSNRPFLRLLVVLS